LLAVKMSQYLSYERYLERLMCGLEI
jgi:hypothetical protein